MVTEKLQASQTREIVRVPRPRFESSCSIEHALHERRSSRELDRKAALTLQEISQLLWAGHGITSGDGFRTAPSAGALYPLELYLVAGRVHGLDTGIYNYLPAKHRLLLIAVEDPRAAFANAAYGQTWLKHAAAVLDFAAVESRTTGKYGRRGIRYVHVETGHAAQGVLLQAVSLGVAGAVVGAFEDKRVAEVLRLPEEEQALYLLVLGRPERGAG
jgi:SagB-type dehydrogenase family enzyme